MAFCLHQNSVRFNAETAASLRVTKPTDADCRFDRFPYFGADLLRRSGLFPGLGFLLRPRAVGHNCNSAPPDLRIQVRIVMEPHFKERSSRALGGSPPEKRRGNLLPWLRQRAHGRWLGLKCCPTRAGTLRIVSSHLTTAPVVIYQLKIRARPVRATRQHRPRSMGKSPSLARMKARRSHQRSSDLSLLANISLCRRGST